MLTARKLAAYSALGVPLAFAGLPIYVHVPHYYATVQHMDLVTISAILLVIRFVDAFQDPFIGYISDKISRRKRLIAWSMILLGISFTALFAAPDAILIAPSVWMCVTLFLVYTAFSTVMINFFAAGLPLADTPHGHTRISGAREAAMLIGVMIAAALPQLFERYMAPVNAYRIFALCFIPIAVICTIAALRIIPDRAVTTQTAGFRQQFALLHDMDIRRMLLLFFVNAIPTAITSTLFLFFVQDILVAHEQAGAMLIVYFLAAALSVPLWTKLAAHYGKLPVLRVGMILAIISFIWAYSLGAGDILSFYLICLGSGVAMGADMTLLPSLFADVMERKPEQAAIGYSLWNFTSKLTLSLAAGLVLPLLSWQGYTPSSPGKNNLAILSLGYAVIPCLFKCVSLILTYRLYSPQERRQ